MTSNNEDMHSSSSSFSMSPAYIPRAMHDSFKSLEDEVAPVKCDASAATTTSKVRVAKAVDGKLSTAELESAVTSLRSAVSQAKSDLEKDKSRARSDSEKDKSRALRRSWRMLKDESDSALQERLAGALDREVKSFASVDSLRAVVEELRSRKDELSEEVDGYRRTSAEEKARAEELQDHLNSVMDAARRRRNHSIAHKSSQRNNDAAFAPSSSFGASTVTRESKQVISRMASSIFGRLL
uniref:Uncharacterized protein n=1 Tax=Odontella aurita TaxID=265563 RepID=A0A7S4K3Z6_9STRA